MIIYKYDLYRDALLVPTHILRISAKFVPFILVRNTYASLWHPNDFSREPRDTKFVKYYILFVHVQTNIVIVIAWCG